MAKTIRQKKKSTRRRNKKQLTKTKRNETKRNETKRKINNVKLIMVGGNKEDGARNPEHTNNNEKDTTININANNSENQNIDELFISLSGKNINMGLENCNYIMNVPNNKDPNITFQRTKDCKSGFFEKDNANMKNDIQKIKDFLKNIIIQDNTKPIVMDRYFELGILRFLVDDSAEYFGNGERPFLPNKYPNSIVITPTNIIIKYDIFSKEVNIKYTNLYKIQVPGINIQNYDFKMIIYNNLQKLENGGKNVEIYDKYKDKVQEFKDKLIAENSKIALGHLTYQTNSVSDITYTKIKHNISDIFRKFSSIKLEFINIVSFKDTNIELHEYEGNKQVYYEKVCVPNIQKYFSYWKDNIYLLIWIKSLSIELPKKSSKTLAGGRRTGSGGRARTVPKDTITTQVGYGFYLHEIGKKEEIIKTQGEHSIQENPAQGENSLQENPAQGEHSLPVKPLTYDSLKTRIDNIVRESEVSEEIKKLDDVGIIQRDGQVAQNDIENFSKLILYNEDINRYINIHNIVLDNNLKSIYSTPRTIIV